MTWLITGGAGYIGAHVVRGMLAEGHDLVVLDDESSGDASRIPKEVPYVCADMRDSEKIRQIFHSYDIRGVVHLAAKKQVDESVRNPSLYYRTNVEALRQLLDQCTASGVENFVFSSSAAVYGTQKSVPISEDAVCMPDSPYGETKLAGEWLTKAIGAASGMRTLSLRYFNVAGAASPDLANTTADNLVPIVLDAINRGQSPQIFGDDYATKDGTCVRDFVHVVDVASAHVAAVKALETDDSAAGAVVNIGTGAGVTVREVVDHSIAISGKPIEPVVVARREADIPESVASVEKAHQLLDWKAQHDLNDMIASAWQAWTKRENRE